MSFPGGFPTSIRFTGSELRLAVLNYEITLGRIKLSVTVVVDNPLISANLSRFNQTVIQFY
jgi:hypothetical protein